MQFLAKLIEGANANCRKLKLPLWIVPCTYLSFNRLVIELFCYFFSGGRYISIPLSSVIGIQEAEILVGRATKVQITK